MLSVKLSYSTLEKKNNDNFGENVFKLTICSCAQPGGAGCIECCAAAERDHRGDGADRLPDPRHAAQTAEGGEA